MDLEPLYQIVRKYEGLRLKVYRCPAGVPTIGYGSTGRDITMAHPDVTIEWAENRMRDDVAFFVKQALQISPVLASHPNKLCAIASFCYNLGATAYKGSTLCRKVNASTWQEAAAQFEKWVFAGGKKLNGLIKRRAEEKELFLTPYKGAEHGRIIDVGNQPQNRNSTTGGQPVDIGVWFKQLAAAWRGN
jgi:lysozyme